MLSPAHLGAAHRRAALAVGLAAVVIAVVIGVGAISLGTPNAGAGSAREAGVGREAHVGRVSLLTPASTLGSAVGDTALGLRTSYYQPTLLTDPSNPGIIINSGPDEPDPFIIQQGGRYYLFTSQSGVLQNVPVQSGTKVGDWGPVSDALPDSPAWAVPGFFWAPDVVKFGNHYMLYFTSKLKNSNPPTVCIGEAISTAVAGPYIPTQSPLICQLSLGGSLDPRVFVNSDGAPSIVWKSNQNALTPATTTQIWSQTLSTDGTHLTGQPTVIFEPDEPWQNAIAEAPQLVLVQGTYYLFYSGGWFNQSSYAIGVARCSGPMGPCHDTSPTPLLASNAQGQGPGEESVFANAVGIWLLYTPSRSTLPLPGPPRPVAMAHLGFGPDGPYLAAPYQT